MTVQTVILLVQCLIGIWVLYAVHRKALLPGAQLAQQIGGEAAAGDMYISGLEIIICSIAITWIPLYMLSAGWAVHLNWVIALVIAEMAYRPIRRLPLRIFARMKQWNRAVTLFFLTGAYLGIVLLQITPFRYFFWS